MRKLILISSIFLFAGCAASQSNPEDLRKISFLETEMSALKSENSELKAEVDNLNDALVSEAKRQKVIYRMPGAKEIQAALKNAGFYKGAIDNQIGTATKEAIMKFQKANGLEPDGVVGTRTWEKMSAYLEEPKKVYKIQRLNEEKADEEKAENTSVLPLTDK